MNERIQELLKQAGGIQHDEDGDELTAFLVGKDLEKFAELIVKEMCDMMEQTEDDAYSLEPSERPTEYIQFLYDWRTRFEQHFGVEE